MLEKDFSLLKPYTNYDKIRDMSIEEMAQFILCPNNHLNFKNKLLICDLENTSCIECCKKWLESEAEK